MSSTANRLSVRAFSLDYTGIAGSDQPHPCWRERIRTFVIAHPK